MRLAPDWHKILTRAWSVRLNLFNAFCQGILWGTAAFFLDLPWYVIGGFLLLCEALCIAPIVARVLWQADFHPDNADD